MRLLDLFCGKWGWSRAFAARGWECHGVDLVHADMIVPSRCHFIQADVLDLGSEYCRNFDFIVASSPCQEFSKYGMRCFFPSKPYPANGIKLFNSTREILWNSGIPWVMENVRAAQEFVGQSTHHCGPFHLWGTGVPPLMPQGILKGARLAGGKIFADTPMEERRKIRAQYPRESKRTMPDSEFAAAIATIPPELANCVADYAERLLESGGATSRFIGRRNDEAREARRRDAARDSSARAKAGLRA